MYTVFVIADASRVQSCCNQAVCGGGSLDTGLVRSTTPKPRIHQATKRAERHYATDLGPRVRLQRQPLRNVAIAYLHQADKRQH
jgi:hypothetical protein